MAERFPHQAIFEVESPPASGRWRATAAALPDPAGYRAILGLSLPLILSTSGQTLMQMLDGLFLAWYSADAVAAVGPAAMISFIPMSFFLGATGYTSTFVAQYAGAGRLERTGAVVWQGIYLAMAAALAVALISLSAPAIFAAAGHAPAIAAMETRFVQICWWGAFFPLAGSAIAGFFTGLGRMKTVMAVNFAGQAANALLAYLLIFGWGSLPAMGVSGAAWASVLAQALMTALFFLLFLRKAHDNLYGVWRGSGWCWALLLRLARFGLPNGVRFGIEVAGWAIFLLFVGRLGRDALAASSIAWRINAVAFLPMIGLGMALSTLVGQAQGEGTPERSRRATWRALAVTQVWMMASALLFVAWPDPLIALFSDQEGGGEGIASLTRLVLRYVAAYCLLDGFNVVFASALQGAGDTRFMLAACAIMYSGFVAVLAVLDLCGAGLHGFWLAATVFVMALALLWLWRFLSGKWRHMRIIEPAVE